MAMTRWWCPKGCGLSVTSNHSRAEDGKHFDCHRCSGEYTRLELIKTNPRLQKMYERGVRNRER